MDERTRLRKLEALGIDVYLRRAPVAPAVDTAATPATDRVTEERGTGRFGVDEPADGPLSTRVPPSQAGDAVAAAVSGMDWDALRATVSVCTRCELHATRTQTVFGVGDPHARLMFIGEAPGADEDRRGEPFVGRAGQLLTQMIRAMGFAREQVFIANILKCRPPGNRDPKPNEASRCRPYLERQIELVSPTLIVAVGRISAQTLLATDAPLARLRGRVHELGAARRPLIVTYHPAYLLRTPGDKRKAWQDLQFVLRTQRELEARSGA